MERTNYWTRRLSRRHALGAAGLAGTGVAGLALVGCGDDDNKGSQPAPGETKASGSPAASPSADASKINKDGVLKARQGAIFSTINPYKGLDSGLTWGFTIFDHLWYTPTDTGIRENFLASSIEQPDPLHFTIKMQDSVFHDKPPINGREVRAQDVKASFESASKQPAISASSWWKDSLDKIETPDNKTLTFTLKQIDAWSFSSTNAGSPISSSIIPEEIAKAPDFMDKELIGSGRYQFVSHENGANFKIKRFDKWRIKGEPWLAGIDYKLIQEQAAALAAFSSQQIDSVAPNNKLERDQLDQKHGKAIEIDNDLSASIWTLEGRADGPWADPRVRQAVNMAIDRNEFIALMNFGDGQVSGPIPPGFKSYALDEKELATLLKFDAAEARKLLAATSFDTSKEFELKFYVPGDRPAQFAQIVQSQLQKNLGLKIKLVGEDFGTWLQKSLYGSNFSGFITYPTLSYDDPSSYVGSYTKSIGGRENWSKFFDDELDALVNKQKQILDDRLRIEAIKDIQRKALAKAAPFLPIFVAITSTATWGYVKGRVRGRGSYGLFTGQAYIDKS